MKHKVLLITALVLLGIVVAVGYTAAGQDIKLEINGALISPDAAPHIQNGRVFVPVRFISEVFGADVNWDPATSTVKIILEPAAAGPGLAGGAVLSSSLTQERRTLTFPNDTNQEVNDLHVELKPACGVADPGPFGDFTGGETSVIDFSNPANNVQPGANVRIGFIPPGRKDQVKIEKWYWTKDGKQVGAVHTK